MTQGLSFYEQVGCWASPPYLASSFRPTQVSSAEPVSTCLEVQTPSRIGKYLLTQAELDSLFGGVCVVCVCEVTWDHWFLSPTVVLKLPSTFFGPWHH